MRRYLLRWRFEYLDRPAKYGIWMNPGREPSDQAWAQTKEGLVRALIEGKDRETGETVVLAECPGSDFMNFQWVANALISPFGIKGEKTAPAFLSGMKILARHEEIEVDVTGKVTRRAPEHQNINFASFGR